MRPVRFVILAAALTLLPRGTARAQGPYSLQPIIKLGDQAGDVRTAVVDGGFEISALNDNSQLAFVAENAAGGEALIQATNGNLVPIVAAGKDAPGGKWANEVQIVSPVSMNQLGNIAFVADLTAGSITGPGSFLWDHGAQLVGHLSWA